MDEQTVIQRRIQALYAIADAMGASFNPQTVLDTVLQAIVDTLGYRAAVVRLLDAERETLVLRAACGLSEAYLAKGPVQVANSPMDQAVLAEQVVVLEDITHDEGFQYPAAAAREGLHSILGAPLAHRGRVLGVLRVYTGEAHEFDAEERAFMGAVAKFVARALANAHLFQALWGIVHNVNSSLAVEEVLVQLLRGTLTELNYKAGLIRLVDVKAQVMRLVAAEGLSREYLGKGDVRIGQSAIDTQVLAGKPVTIYDVTTDPRFQYREAAAREGIRSVHAAPLTVRGTVIGVLRVYSGQPHRFSDEETAFLSAVADLGGIAIENARLHQALAEKYETLKTDAAGWYRFLTLS